MIIEFKDAYTERLYEANKAAIAAYKSLDPTDEKYFENVESVSALSKEVDSDFKNFAELENEEASLKEEKRHHIFQSVISGAGIIVTLVTFLIGERNRNARIDKVCAFEDENAVLKMSDRTAVQDCLREGGDQRRGFLGLFNK